MYAIMFSIDSEKVPRRFELHIYTGLKPLDGYTDDIVSLFKPHSVDASRVGYKELSDVTIEEFAKEIVDKYGGDYQPQKSDLGVIVYLKDSGYPLIELMDDENFTFG